MTQQDPAEIYERIFVPGLSASLAEDLLKRVPPQTGERVLDVACGTGIVARSAARRTGPTGRVVGVDKLGPMLAVARRAAGREGVAIDFREGPVESLPVESESFDVVYSQLALMFFVDRAASLREMRRALVRGGRLGVSVPMSLEHFKFYAELDDTLEQHLGVPALARTTFSLGQPDELRRLILDAGFTDVNIEPVVVTTHFSDPLTLVELELDGALEFGAPALAGMDMSAREETFAARRTEAEAILRPYLQGGELVVDAPVHVARARA